MGIDSERKAWRWLIAVLLVSGIVLASIGSFVIWVDPFQHYHLASRFPPRFYSLHHRYINPGLARHEVYDTVLTGSSIMESTPNSVVQAACGGRAINVTMPAISASELKLMLETTFDARPLKRAIVVLDFNAFSGDPDSRQDVAGPLPRYLYDRNPFNDLPYLLSWDVLAKAWRIVTGDVSENFTSDPNAPWYWANRKRFARAEVLRGLDLTNLNKRFQQPARTLAGMQASFERNIVPILKAHSETEFDLVWPPYSALVWLDFAQRDQLEVTLAFKRYVAEVTSAFPYVHVIDLQAVTAVTYDLDRYMDPYHFEAGVNAWLVTAACAHDYAVSAQRQPTEALLRAQVASLLTPEGLARLVGPAAPKAK